MWKVIRRKKIIRLVLYSTSNQTLSTNIKGDVWKTVHRI